MFNIHDLTRNGFMLTGPFAQKGYDWWWHSFTGVSEKTGKERTFFIEFFVCNPALAKDEPVFGSRDGKIRPSYLMVKAGAWGTDAVQLHRFFSLRETEIGARAPFHIQAEDCYVSDTELRGSVSVTPEEAETHPEYMCGAGSMSWNLRIYKDIAFNVGYGAGKLFRALKAFEMYWHAEGMKSAFAGTVEFNGEVYQIDPDSCCGYADKNWGADFTSPWLWLSSCSLFDAETGERLEDSAFDIGGGCPKVFGVALPRQLLSAFCIKGKEYEFNFSKFWNPSFTRFSCEETENRIIWRVMQETNTAVVKAKISCPKREMLFVNYESPDGRKRHNRLWNGGTGTGTILLYRRAASGLIPEAKIRADHIGCEYGEYC